MTEAAANAGARPTGICSACSLLCDDVVPRGDTLERACAAGQAAWAEARAAARMERAISDGRVVSWPDALDRAAACLTDARRVLVTGLADATIDTIAAACDLAEACGAAVDAGGGDAARASGPVIARVGRVTADFDDVRDRADLVVFWFCDPAATHPRFLERFVAPSLPDGVRRTVAVGSATVPPRSANHVHLPLPASMAVTAARALHGLLAGLPTARHVPAALATLLEPLRRAIDAAGCVAFVTATTDDAVGLAPWSTAALVRALALVKPAFEVPLDHGLGAGANAAGAAAVCTWRYGAAGAIASADRGGATSLAGEADALHLIGRGEVDCVVVVGALRQVVEEAIVSRGDGVAVVRISALAGALAPRGVWLRVDSSLSAPSGTMLRGDGRWVPLGVEAAVPAPHSAASVLRSLTGLVSAASHGDGGES